MDENISDSKENIAAWLQFEYLVANLFKLFGYDDVTHDTKIDGGQCDVVAKSRHRNKPNIIAECKYHINFSSKVNITDVQNFIHKVSNYRHSGFIDQGYIVTNSGFTSDARAALNKSTENFVFLVTYDELIESLFDVNHYLQEFITEYDTKFEGRRYVEMRLINTTIAEKTILDSYSGDLIEGKDGNERYLILPRSSVDVTQKLTFLDFESDPFNPYINPIEFLQELLNHYDKSEAARKLSLNHFNDCLSKAIHATSIKFKDDFLYELWKSFHSQLTERENWSVDVWVYYLIDRWQFYGGDIHSKKYKRPDLVYRIRREILRKYRAEVDSLALKKAETSALITIFGSHIMNALKLPILKSRLHRNEIRNNVIIPNEYFVKNFIKKLESDPNYSPKLKLLFEEDALGAIENYIISDNLGTLILIGDYGAGKTTVLRRLMRKLSQDKLNNQHDPKVRIPLYISLKDYNKVPDMNELILSYLRNVVEVSNVSLRTFKELNDEGRFVLLLDAFDEMLSRVTNVDRRRCFREISELISKKSKIILTGRPAYFNDFKELKENLELLKRKFFVENKEIHSNYEIMCLQLLDENQVELLIDKASPDNSKDVLKILSNRPNLMDLARRPVLATMIAETASELSKLEKSEISARNIYEVYTNKWIRREEDKGKFRLLIRPQEKSTFLRYLAMQMHISGSNVIHYRDLSESVKKYFCLNTAEEYDNFSSDIQTCSFLSRTDDGYYFFIHKSFMEYFVACEFERGELSPFSDQFSNDLTIEIIELLDLDNIPKMIRDVWINKENFQNIEDGLKIEKDRAVKNGEFEDAAIIRDFQKLFVELLEDINSIFKMKDYKQIDIIEKIRKYLNGSKDSIIISIKSIINSHLKDLNFDF